MNDFLKLTGVSLSHGPRRVLGPLDLTLREGRITAICGANGSGKSTLLRLLSGGAPSAGRVLLDGQPLSALRGKALGREIAMLGQHQEKLAGISVRELVGFGRFPHRRWLRPATAEDAEAVARALRLTLLEPLAERDISALSGGERQRAWLALALAQEPRLLLLDEPTSYLDIRYQVELLRLLKQLNRETGLTIIAVLHDLNQVIELADEAILLREGQVIAQGEPARIFTADTLQTAFGLRLDMVQEAGRALPYCRTDWLGEPGLAEA
ncbi:ABC transporter ATP-binding protein [Paracoccus aminophilus]|uniref:Iron complex transport system, ATP-binding protein n=1 Tax=Paracoccus aminophilus JCM 7686 TaxID=1367847 RepID=S5YA39_PARAH|nr:ABC transporter ATP-binding protein [Paracoccus aminophilus]AGT08268.1 iron complex transport system, ATP-binding protein [Paracoccus aminophilus JCM 7686]